MSSTRRRQESVRALSLCEAIDRLRTPGSREAFSALQGEPFLVVDLAQEMDLDAQAEAALALALSELPCPSIAWHPGSPSQAGMARLECFDVQVTREEDLACVVEACRSNPLAALSLVQVLRRTLRASVEDGLWAESLAYSTLQSGPEFARWLAGRGPDGPPSAAPEDVLRCERRDGRLELVLTRPEKRNAFGVRLRDRLAESFEVALADEGVREIVWRAEGQAFCAGGDLDEFGSLPDPATAHGVRSTRNVARLVSALAPRLRVEVQGACVGAGVELPAFAARVTARRDAFFALPEVAMGLIPGAGGTVSLPRRIGRQRTAWMALTGVSVDAPTAHAWGLVDELKD